jgi:hypothetical protein
VVYVILTVPERNGNQRQSMKAQPKQKNFTSVEWKHMKHMLLVKRLDLVCELEPLAALSFRNGTKKSAVRTALLECVHRSMTSCSMDKAEDFDVNLLKRSNARMAKRARGLVNRETNAAVRWLLSERAA